jgi:hypothetical protein
MPFTGSSTNTPKIIVVQAMAHHKQFHHKRFFATVLVVAAAATHMLEPAPRRSAFPVMSSTRRRTFDDKDDSISWDQSFAGSSLGPGIEAGAPLDEWTKKMSSQPSLSQSNTAAPEPTVSMR